MGLHFLAVLSYTEGAGLEAKEGLVGFAPFIQMPRPSLFLAPHPTIQQLPVEVNPKRILRVTQNGVRPSRHSSATRRGTFGDSKVPSSARQICLPTVCKLPLSRLLPGCSAQRGTWVPGTRAEIGLEETGIQGTP